MEIKLPETSCTGCGACLQSCRAGAIAMQAHDDGFLYPVIDREKCIRCGLCVKACHALGENELRKPAECFAAQLREKEILQNSTSGGLFTAMASEMIRRGGVVYGCAFDEAYNAKIVRAESVDQLGPMRGSKYVWSDSSESYPLVRQDLDKGREVLYTCLPCQGAGLRKYLGKEYGGLIIADVLCGGAPSPYAFSRYLETLTDEAGKKELNFQFRDKERFGAGVDCTYFRNGKKHYENWLENSFYFAFCSRSRITWRESCYRCGYKSVNRGSHLTIGDFWSAGKYHPDFSSKEGVSLVLINTPAGAEFFGQLGDLLRVQKSEIPAAMERNSLVSEIEDGHVPLPPQREAFFRTLRLQQGWKKADRRFLKLRKKILIKQKIAALSGKIIRFGKNRPQERRN